MTIELSPPQKLVYDLAQQGRTTTEIAVELGMTESVVTAQITRIRRKATLDHPKYAVAESTEPATIPLPESEPKPKQVVEGAAEAGEAVYDIPEILQRAGEQAAKGRDVHPMILLGVTIQFVKLIGGRMHAHQIIEDVYEAMRVMAGDGKAPPEEGSTLPWPKDLEAQNIELREKSISLQQELADLRRSFSELQETLSETL